MLISQIIAQNENALSLPDLTKFGINLKYSTSHPDVVATRNAILQSTKIVVSTDIVHVNATVVMAEDENFWTMQEDLKLMEQFRQFAKLPFNSVFLENITGGYLVRKDPADETAWIVTMISHMPSGLSIPYLHFRARIGELMDDNNYMVVEMLPIGPMAKGLPLFKETKRITTAACHQIAEALLFLNVRNSVTHKYKPKKDEVKKMPAHLRKFYTYRIIDIYRERTAYQSLKEVEADASKDRPKDKSAGRAHMVRGHFKNVRGKLYWWNAYMRNRKNLATVGMVEKDYRLKDDQAE